jgi:hypothetical protein
MPEEDDVPAADRLLRPAFGMYRIEWPGDPGVGFHLSHGDWLRLCGRADSRSRTSSRCGLRTERRIAIVT